MKTSPSAKDVVLAQCVDVLRFKHYSLATEKTYCGHIGSYIDWLLKHGSALPDSRARVEAFLTGMAHRGCSASTQNQAFNALLFLYEQVRKEKLPEIQSLRAKASKHKRTALSRAQTHALLAGVEDQAGYPTRLVTLLLYGCGMRVSEPLNLRIKDLDTSAWRLTLRGCKGGKDRTAIVPECLRAALAVQVEHARAMWRRDRETNLPVEVPGLLAQKYKNAPHSWQWFWVFPSHTACTHPRTGETVRWHMLDQQVQRAVRHSVRRTGLSCTISPHSLRHAYATHALNSGSSIRDIQVAMGHKSIETTMNYCTSEIDRVKSPLESLMAVA